MRCPLCGADNAEYQLTCWSCGAWLPTRRVEDQVDQLMERLSAAATEQVERESLFFRALEAPTQDMDTSWLEDAEERLITSRNVSDEEIQRASELDARAAAFVSDARAAIDFPPVGAVESPRSDPTASDEGYARNYESRNNQSRNTRSRSDRPRGNPRQASPADTFATTPPPAQRMRKRGPRFNRSVVPLVPSDNGSRPRRRRAMPAEPNPPAYAAETRLDTAFEEARAVLSDATPSHATEPQPVVEPEPTANALFEQVSGEPIEASYDEVFAVGTPTEHTRGDLAANDASSEVPARARVDAEHPFGVAENVLVEESPYEAFPEGAFDAPELEDEAWEAYADEELETTTGLARAARAEGAPAASEEADEESPASRAAIARVEAVYQELMRGSSFDRASEDRADGDAAAERADDQPRELPEEPAHEEVPDKRDTYEAAADEPESEDVPDSSDVDAEPEATELLEPGVTELLEPDDAPKPNDAPAPKEQVVAQTVQRPVVSGRQEPLNNGGHFVVRNTRDYDHDAQSTNLVNAGDQFDTLTESRDARKLRNDPYARSKRRGYVPGEGNSRGLLRPFLAVLLVALVLAGGAAVLTYGLEMWGGISVPLVTGYQQASAEQRLNQKGFIAVIEAEPADDAIGIVASQSPEPGTRLPEGSEVILRVATNRTVPDVMGMTEDEARLILEKTGAEHVVTEVEPSTEPEGTVIAVKPGVGEPFVSRVELKITIAGPYIVPDVLTKKEQDAIEAIKQAGFEANVTYVNSDQTVRTVVETIPEAGTAYEHGATVEVHVSTPYPSDPYHLAEYFGHSSHDDNDYLLKQGFTFEGGAIESGQALAVYNSTDKGNISFSSTPHAHQLKVTKKDEANALASEMPFSAVRVDLPAWYAPGGFDEGALKQVAELCGLSGLTDSCNNLTLTLPSGVSRLTVPFGCISGTMDDLVWTVLVIGDGESVPVRVSATCAKEGVYASADLAGFGGNVSQYAAYQEIYASKEFEPKAEEKKDDKKDDAKKDDADKKDGESTNDASKDDKSATDEQHETAAA